MKISYNWLKQFLKLDWEPEKTGELLTNLGLEIEGIERFQSIAGGLEGVVVGEVLTCVKHPNADRLKLTTVDIGNDDALQIICGAPNVDVGQKVPVATVGCTLSTISGETIEIKKGKIRGELSHGMICAEDELGLGTSHDGIMVLDDSFKPGTPASEVFEIELDDIFEIGLTPNRADAMSHYGVARDLRAGLLQQEINLELITPSVSAFHLDSRTLKIDVDVLDKQRAPRYCGVTLTGLSIQDSPLWLQNRLKAIGLSPINNIVDVTNYVLHELGQPLHAFDAAKISGNKIEVRTLPKGTKFTTLDEVERVLHEEDLMICDAEKPMCIAGVFGGINSGVTEETTSIFLESAYFDPVSIRKTAKRHGLNTDASFRFERGIDPNITEYALKRAVLLILEVAGGEVSSDVVDAYPNKIEDYQVVMSFENAKRLIGEEIPRETIKSILTSLEIKVNNVTETGLGLTVPAYRNDVQREADIIEEILRVYGYNRVPTAEKLNASVSYSSQYEDHRLQNVIGDMLVAKGCFEMMTNSLTTDKYAELTEQINAEEVVTLLNPLSQDLASLRQSMLFSTLETVSYNINRQQVNLKLFEFGKTYGLKEAEFREDKHLALVITGEKNPESWTLESQRSDFFELKGLVQAVIKRLGIHYQDISSVENDYFSEGLTIKVKGKSLVDFGPVKQSVLKSFGIEQPVLFADFNWDMALELAPLSTLSYEDIPKYPEVRRDFALLLDEHVSFDTINTIARKTERKLLKSVNLFDVYQGGKLPKGKKSYAVSFILQDKKKTLTDKQIDKIMARLQANFEKEVGAELR